MPTYTQKQLDSQAAYKAKIANSTPGATSPNPQLYSGTPMKAAAPADSGMARDKAAFDALTPAQQQQKLHGTPSPAQEYAPAAAPAQPKQSIYDLYGMDKSSQPQSDIFGMYGVEQPTYKAADTSKYDKLISQYQPTDESARIKEMLDSQLAEISNRYGIERENVKRQTQDEFQSQLSGLYNVGVVNPLSSGTGSIDSASDQILDRRMAAVRAQEAAERSQAIAAAYGLETKAKEKALDFAKEERARLEQQTKEQYDVDRQQMTDKINMVNTVVNAWKSGQAVSRQEKEDAQKNVMDMISTFGSGAFEGMDEAKIGELEKSTGYPEGTLAKGIATLKQKELVEGREKLNLHSVNGSLYNISRDSDGNVKADLIVQGKARGSGNGTTKPKKEKFEDWLKGQEETNMMSYDISNPNILQSLIASYEADTGAGVEKIISEGFKQYNKPEFSYEIRKIGTETYQLKKDKSGQVVDKTLISGDAGDDTEGSNGELSEAEKEARRAFGIED